MDVMRSESIQSERCSTRPDTTNIEQIILLSKQSIHTNNSYYKDIMFCVHFHEYILFFAKVILRTLHQMLNQSEWWDLVRPPQSGITV